MGHKKLNINYNDTGNFHQKSLFDNGISVFCFFYSVLQPPDVFRCLKINAFCKLDDPQTPFELKLQKMFLPPLILFTVSYDIPNKPITTAVVINFLITALNVDVVMYI